MQRHVSCVSIAPGGCKSAAECARLTLQPPSWLLLQALWPPAVALGCMKYVAVKSACQLSNECLVPPAGLDTAVLLLRNCDWSRQFVDEVLSYRNKEVRSIDQHDW